MNHIAHRFDADGLSFAQQESQFSGAFAILRQAIQQRAFPGAALAVTHRGSLVASQGFGRFTYEDDAPEVCSDTVFDLASLTKVLAATAMAMLLHQRGRLPLEAALADFLPEFVGLAPPGQRARRSLVTLRMLLAHSSGLPAYEKLFEFTTNREELIRAATTCPLTADPGSKAVYSDIGFILLGEALRRVAGEPLDSWVAREVFAPLSMNRTGFNPPDEDRAAIPPTEEDQSFRRRVMQGDVDDENAWLMDGVSAHAGLFAPATDVARFAECMLRGGRPIFRGETVELFTKREISPSGTSRALGWDTPSQPTSSSGHYFSPRSFGHLGFTGTSLWIDPERQLSATLLTNRTWPDRKSQAIKEVRPRVHDAIVTAL